MACLNRSEEQAVCLESFMADGRVRAASPVLIISYETFRLYAKILHSSAIGMVICDEVWSSLFRCANKALEA